MYACLYLFICTLVDACMFACRHSWMQVCIYVCRNMPTNSLLPPWSGKAPLMSKVFMDTSALDRMPLQYRMKQVDQCTAEIRSRWCSCCPEAATVANCSSTLPSGAFLPSRSWVKNLDLQVLGDTTLPRDQNHPVCLSYQLPRQLEALVRAKSR